MRQSSAAIGPLRSARLSFASRMSAFAVAIGGKADIALGSPLCGKQWKI